MEEVEWRARQRAHRERVDPWITPRAERRRTGAKHPTDDFLFEYYPYSLNKLRTWHPGLGVVLEGQADEFLAHPAYRRSADGVGVDVAALAPKRSRLDLAVDLLGQTLAKQGSTACFALHEWAMVYGLEQHEVRHAAFPLRLAPAEIRQVVDAVGLRCTHIDAFRFFTPEAVPRNAFTPTRERQPEMEQPACLHANMDLYKVAMWFSPFISSDLVADCFALARQARALDMQASPYDVEPLGLRPVRVETAEGRREFVERQLELAGKAQELRGILLERCLELRAALDEAVATAAP